jgi:hypothetical protein
MFLHFCSAEGCCGCIQALRPQYKRLVDNIFPANPQVNFFLAFLQSQQF